MLDQCLHLDALLLRRVCKCGPGSQGRPKVIKSIVPENAAYHQTSKKAASTSDAEC